MIQSNIIHQAYVSRVKKLIFLGSSCIYPKLAPQPLKEEFLLRGLLEPTNEPYAIAKIAGKKCVMPIVRNMVVILFLLCQQTYMDRMIIMI